MITVKPLNHPERITFFASRLTGWERTLERLRNGSGLGILDVEMFRFAEAIARLPNADQLHATTCLFDVVVSDTDDFERVNGLVLIRFMAEAERFLLYHVDMDCRQEIATSPPETAVMTYLEMVEEKFPIAARPASEGRMATCD